MKREPKTNAGDKANQQVRRAASRLLLAVEKAIKAADEAKQARDELLRLSGTEVSL